MNHVLENLFLNRYDQVLGYLRWQTGNYADSEDLAMKGFEFMLQMSEDLQKREMTTNQLHSFWKKSAFYFYLNDVTRNRKVLFLSIELREELAQDGGVEPFQFECAGRLPQAELEGKELSSEVREAIVTLGEDHRDAILRFHFRDESEKDIAEAMGLTVFGVKARLKTARQNLREALRKTLDFAEPVLLGCENTPQCSHCGCHQIVRSGLGKLGQQRYRCRGCGKCSADFAESTVVLEPTRQCPKCGNPRMRKGQIDKNGKRRYNCGSCRKSCY